MCCFCPCLQRIHYQHHYLLEGKNGAQEDNFVPHLCGGGGFHIFHLFSGAITASLPGSIDQTLRITAL